MELRILTAEQVIEAVPMPEAIDAMREAFIELSAGRAVAPLRLPLETRHGVHLFMPAHLERTGVAGAKVVSVNPGNPSLGLPSIHAVVLVLDPVTGRPLALMDGTRLTALRTGAVGGLAADLMARPDASVVALFGAGPQAYTQLEAVRCVRRVEEVRVLALTLDVAEGFAADVEGVRVVPMADPDRAVAGADIVITATNSLTPVFDGSRIEAGTHVTGVGSYTPEMREVDTALVTRARVVVDQREAAWEEAGDLIGPREEGAVDESIVVAEIGEVAAGLVAGRLGPEDITFFKSVGNAVQDVAVAARVLAVAEAEGMGIVVDL